MPTPLIIRNSLGLGDIATLTALPRDIHAAYPGRFTIDMRTSCGELWSNNPYVTQVPDGTAGVIDLVAHCPQVNQSCQAPVHLVSSWHHYVGDQLGLTVPCTYFGGDLHLSEREREQDDIGRPYWVVVNGGKQDVETKHPIPGRVQGVVDRLADRTWVQVGMSDHVHARLQGDHVIDMIDKTNLRDLVRLIYHARGVLSGVTGPMHVAAAVPQKPGHPRRKPCVVMAGGREPEQWAGYPGQRWLGVTSGLRCCDWGCWKNDVNKSGPGSVPCVDVVQVDGRRTPRCMSMISVDQIVAAVRTYDAWWE